MAGGKKKAQQQKDDTDYKPGRTSASKVENKKSLGRPPAKAKVTISKPNKVVIDKEALQQPTDVAQEVMMIDASSTVAVVEHEARQGLLDDPDVIMSESRFKGEDDYDDDEDDEDEEDDMDQWLNVEVDIYKKNKLTAEEQKKKEEREERERIQREKEDQEFNEYKVLRGPHVSPCDGALKVKQIAQYRQLCKARQAGCKAVYTYADLTKSLGIIFSFVEKGEWKTVPITLNLLIYVASDPKGYLQTIRNVAKFQAINRIALPPQQEEYKQVQEGAEEIVNLVTVDREVRFWLEWLDLEANRDDIAEFRQILKIPQQQKEKKPKVNDDDDPNKRKAGQSMGKVNQRATRVQTKQQEIEARHQDHPMDGIDDGKLGESPLDLSFSSLRSLRSEYCHHLFQLWYAQNTKFRTIFSENIIRTQAFFFWSKHGLAGELKLLKLTGKSKGGRIYVGSPIKRFCVRPGKIWSKVRCIKQEVLDQMTQKEKAITENQKTEILIANIKMNYYGFNAFALIDCLDIPDQVSEAQKNTKEAFEKAQATYFGKGSEEKKISDDIINFNRIEYAVDLAAYIKSLPKPAPGLAPKERLKEKQRLEDPRFEFRWARNPPATDQITSMAMMFNNLFDYSFFFNKLFMLQVMCVMSQADPIDLLAGMSTKPELCDLSNYFAFDNEWTFYSFKKDFHVDVEGIDPKKRQEIDQKEEEDRQKKKTNTKATKDFNKEQLEAAKTEADRAEEERKRKEREDAAKKKADNRPLRNPDNVMLQKYMKDEEMKDVEAKAIKEPPPEVTIVSKFNKVKQDWHVFDYIKEQYIERNYGPFIVQMVRIDSKKHCVTEYAVIKHIKGENQGCVVFNQAGPMFYRFTQFKDRAFPLSGIYYYYSKDSIPKYPKDEAKLKNANELIFQRKKVKDKYKTCSIFSLKRISEEKRDEDIKYRILYELIWECGKWSLERKGNKKFLEDLLKGLMNPVDTKDYTRLGPQHRYLSNIDAVETIMLGKKAEKEHPDAAIAAMQYHPYIASEICEQNIHSDQEMKVFEQEAKILSFLQQFNLTNYRGGIDIRNGGFNGLMSLRYHCEKTYRNATHILNKAAQEQQQHKLSSDVDMMVKRQTLLNSSNNYILERQVCFFLHTVSTALISFMLFMDLDKYQMSNKQEMLFEKVLADNHGRLDIEETLELLVSLYTTREQKDKWQQLVQLYGEKAKDHYTKYFDQIAEADSNPTALSTHNDFKYNIASILMTPIDGGNGKNLEKTGLSRKERRRQNQLQRKQPGENPVDKNRGERMMTDEQQESYRFSIAQVMSKFGLRRMFEKIMNNYSLEHLGGLRRDCKDKVKQFARRELLLVEKEDDPNVENGVYCYTYNRYGQLICNEDGVPEYRKYNITQKVLHWRSYARAAINADIFKGRVPEQIDIETLEENEYFSAAIQQNRKASYSKYASTNESSAKKEEGVVGERLIKDDDEYNHNMLFQILENQAEEGCNEFTMDDKLKPKYTPEPFDDGDDTMDYMKQHSMLHQDSLPGYKSLHSTSKSWAVHPGTDKSLGGGSRTFIEHRSRTRTPVSTGRTPVPQMSENQRRQEQRIRDQERARGGIGGGTRYPFANQRMLNHDYRQDDLTRRIGKSESPDDTNVKRESKGKHRTPSPPKRR